MEITYTIEENNKTIKQILKERLFISDRLLTFLKKNSLILYNNDKITNLNILARLNSTVTVDLNFEEDNNNIVPIKMDLKIIYEDEALLIIDKPAGIPVHPSILHYTNSLSNGVKYYFDSDWSLSDIEDLYDAYHDDEEDKAEITLNEDGVIEDGDITLRK